MSDRVSTSEDVPRARPSEGEGTPAYGAELSENAELAMGFSCVSCGYELAGLDLAGVCPECGTAIQKTLDRVRLLFRDGWNLAGMRWWARILGITGLAMPALFPLAYYGADSAFYLGTFGMLLVVLGLRALTPCASAEVDARAGSRAPEQVSVILGVVGSIVTMVGLVALTGLVDLGDFVPYLMLPLVHTLTIAVGMLSASTCIAVLAAGLHDRLLKGYARLTRISLGVVVGMHVLTMGLLTFGMELWACLGVVMLGVEVIFALVGAISFLLLMVWFSRRIRSIQRLRGA